MPRQANLLIPAAFLTLALTAPAIAAEQFAAEARIGGEAFGESFGLDDDFSDDFYHPPMAAGFDDLAPQNGGSDISIFSAEEDALLFAADDDINFDDANADTVIPSLEVDWAYNPISAEQSVAIFAAGFHLIEGSSGVFEGRVDQLEWFSRHGRWGTPHTYIDLFIQVYDPIESNIDWRMENPLISYIEGQAVYTQSNPHRHGITVKFNTGGAFYRIESGFDFTTTMLFVEAVIRG